MHSIGPHLSSREAFAYVGGVSRTTNKALQPTANPLRGLSAAGLDRCASRLANFREKFRGHLFQERFFSCPFDLVHLSAAARLVVRKPVRAGICRHAKDFPWSGARFHLRMIDRDPLVQQSQWIGSPEDWKEYLKEESHDLERFREHIRTGNPIGDDRF